MPRSVRRPTAGAAGATEKIKILKIIQTPSCDTSMERGDQFEHFGSKIIQKYHFWCPWLFHLLAQFSFCVLNLAKIDKNLEYFKISVFSSFLGLARSGVVVFKDLFGILLVFWLFCLLWLNLRAKVQHVHVRLVHRTSATNACKDQEPST